MKYIALLIVVWSFGAQAQIKSDGPLNPVFTTPKAHVMAECMLGAIKSDRYIVMSDSIEFQTQWMDLEKSTTAVLAACEAPTVTWVWECEQFRTGSARGNSGCMTQAMKLIRSGLLDRERKRSQ
jgi:hypothetical protein